MKYYIDYEIGEELYTTDWEASEGMEAMTMFLEDCKAKGHTDFKVVKFTREDV